VAKKKYYAVRRGRRPGIYSEWFGSDGAQVQVAGFRGAIYKGFATRGEAEQFLNPATGATGGNRPDKRDERPDDAAEYDNRIQVFTDGGAVGNPGPGGFGVVIIRPDGQRQELCGGYQWTTNNRMEMMGCITALEALDGNAAITLHSDSRYLVDAVNKGWARGWQRRGWKKADNAPARNVDLWKRLLPLLDGGDIRLKWVKGHAGNTWNERCDQLVHEAIAKGDLRVDEGYAPEAGSRMRASPGIKDQG
jgi:ribonuclease HI